SPRTKTLSGAHRRDRWRLDLDLCAVSRSVRSLVSGLAGVWERLGRSRRLSRAQYSCAVGVVHSVPQLGAVLVPLNFLLIADDFLYLLNHSGARIVCAHRDYLETIDSIRSRLPRVEHFIALTGEANDWLDYERSEEHTSELQSRGHLV